MLTVSVAATEQAKSNIAKKFKMEMEKVNEILGINLTIPEPVFFCSIEPPSLSAQTALEQALIELQREDQSLRVSQNSETGQTVLAGRFEV